MAKKGASSKAADQAAADEQARQARIRQGTADVNKTFGQFDDPYFAQQRDNYLGFALPQLDDQYGEAQKQLTFALARDGNTYSSAAAEQRAKLQKQYDQNKITIADQGQNYANQSRSSVEEARANVIASLNASGDATQAANSAVARSAALAQPQGYSPIGDLFGSAMSAFAQQAALERSQSLGGAGGRYNTGLFGTSAGRGSVKVT
ncbi:MAG: hypothetical protein WAP03_19355 [Methylorubrum rhodinum]|uniref:hypothetical protein n=1 Tax=Methylorubrum rhodinum TaxID=29428 RepID=UPI003BAE7D75